MYYNIFIMKNISFITLIIINICIIILIILFSIAYIQLGLSNVETAVGPSWSMFIYFTMASLFTLSKNYMSKDNYGEYKKTDSKDDSKDLSSFLPEMNNLLNEIKNNSKFDEDEKKELIYIVYAHYMNSLKTNKNQILIDKINWYLKNVNNDLSNFSVIYDPKYSIWIDYDTNLDIDDEHNKMFILYHVNKKKNIETNNNKLLQKISELTIY